MRMLFYVSGLLLTAPGKVPELNRIAHNSSETTTYQRLLDLNSKLPTKMATFF